MNTYAFQSAGRQGVRVTALLAALLLTACGGGGGNPGATGSSAGTGSTGSTGGTGTTVTATPTVTLAFTNASGSATNALSGATPLTVKATVVDKDKKPVPNAIVAFSTLNTLATFSPAAGTALTDANGVATVTMRTASLSAGGAGTVTATTSVAGTSVSGTGNYSVGATALAFGTLAASPASLQAYGSTVLSVDLLNGTSKYTDQQVNVNFTSACVAAGKATLAATVATNNGTAQTVYRDKGCGNNDVITISADGVSKSASTTLTIAPPAAASVQFVSAQPTNQSIVIQGQGGNGRTETATLTFKVVDIFGNALAGKQVNFTTTSPNVKINKASDTTDASGVVITTVNSGSTPTSFRVQATLPGTGINGGPDISTMSDSVVVTTGQPVQRAFSLSTGSFNVEGWDYDSSPTKPATTINVMVADASGNPVPDGTPIVFQTNMGSIGSADKGGCNTVNGGCSVDLRAQLPRLPTPNSPVTPCNSGTGSSADSTRRGLATICASTTDGTNTVFAKTSVFFSGSTVRYVVIDGSNNPIDVSTFVDPTKTIDLGTVSASQSRPFTIELDDVNLNPLPSGTTVSVTSLVHLAVAPPGASTVMSTPVHTLTADVPAGQTNLERQGTVHSFSVSAINSGSNCTPGSGTFTVAVTTPLGLTTNIPFKLTYTCP